MNGIQEVSGSIPLISTKRKALKPLYINGFRLFLIFESFLQNESVNKKCQQIQKIFVVCSFFFALSTILLLSIDESSIDELSIDEFLLYV